MQIPTTSIPPTATPSPAEVVEKATQVIDAWNSLGPLMAVLGICALALLFALALAWINRNGQSTVVSVLASNSAQKDKEIADLREQRKQEHEQHIESLTAIAIQGNRSNDLSEEANKILKAQMERGLERDATQKQLADDFHALISTGSKPVQEILARVLEIAETVKNIDTRHADWTTVLNALTPLMVELGALRQEAKKHSTQPIPVIDSPTNGEASPI